MSKWRAVTTRATNAAVLAVAAFVFVVVANQNTVDALPSFGTKIPNGERVPCPTTDDNGNGNDNDNGTRGCTPAGFCLGLGHFECAGFQPEDKTIAENGTTTTHLNPFGEDWRAAGFVWTKELCELDSDGDGFTNGDELGDPCCVWSLGSAFDEIAGFVPSHPGRSDDTPLSGLVLDKAIRCGTEQDDDINIAADIDIAVEDDDDDEGSQSNTTDSAADAHYNPRETRGEFEFRIRPYPIPVSTTTYVDFIVNLPDDMPDVVHVVFTEMLVSQPDHLHHLVITGCASPVAPEDEGVPLENVSFEDCNTILGGWSPGNDVFGAPSLEEGVALGRGLGFAALHINVHYTDGVYNDDGTQRMATDGLRIFYTPDFRPYTALPKSLIWVSSGPSELVIPAGESRHFVSRTCNVGTSCRDASDKQLQWVAGFLGLGGASGGRGRDNDEDEDSINSMLQGLSCGSIKALCYLDGELRGRVQQFCPVTCGLCDDTTNGNPRNPGTYTVTGINYHAHLLGSEMYATLLREVETENDQASTSALLQKQATLEASTSTTTANDLKSRDIWHFDDQVIIPMDYDIAAANANTATTVLTKGVQVKPGDKIQVSCVYDSTARTEDTVFGPSTYDEMCIIQVFVTFPTPEAMLGDLDASSAAMADMVVDMTLRSFHCDMDDEFHTTDVYQGVLADTEDGRNIWNEHPIRDTNSCTFRVADFIFRDDVLTMEQNCPEGTESKYYPKEMCSGYVPLGAVFEEGTTRAMEFVPDEVAGHTCYGGDHDQSDGFFDNVSRDKCETGGGTSYEPYTCLDAEDWMDTDEALVEGDEVLDYVRAVWQPMCCIAEEDEPVLFAEEDEPVLVSSANHPQVDLELWALSMAMCSAGLAMMAV